MTEKTVADILRAKFRPEEVGKLPRVTCPNCSKGNCGEHKKQKCNVCSAYVSERHIHIDYVGHADVTARLLEADPEWNWEPLSTDEKGLPVFDADDRGGPVGLWIRLTVGGVSRLGYGSAPSNQPDVVKVLIGDALRNAAMRFGVALDLWAKGDRADPTAENATASAGQAARGGRPQSAGEAFDSAGPKPPGNGNGHAPAGSIEKPAQAAKPSHQNVDEDAQPYAEEVSQCTSIAALSDVNTRAREAHKTTSLIRNPATGGTGGLGQYIQWKRRQLEDVEKALTELMEAAAAAGLAEDVEAQVVRLTGVSIEAATAQQLRDSAAALAGAAVPA